MASGTDDRPTEPAHPGCASAVSGAGHLRREGSGDELRADRGAASAGGRAERARRAARRRRLRGVERVRWAVRHSGRGAARRGRAEVHPVPHDCAVRADASGVAHRSQPPLGRDGLHHRARDVGAGLQRDPSQHGRAARGDPQAERVLDVAVRQVPRGAGAPDEPDGPVRRVADRWRRLRVLLRLHQRRDEPVLPGDLRGHDAARAAQDAGGGLPLHRGHDRQGHRVGAPAEVVDARPAVLHVLRAGRDARARTMCPRTGSTATAVASTRAGTRSGTRSSPARRRSG